jgi:hypothetical protein
MSGICITLKSIFLNFKLDLKRELKHLNTFKPIFKLREKKEDILEIGRYLNQ